jgi:hypothetical protein
MMAAQFGRAGAPRSGERQLQRVWSMFPFTHPIARAVATATLLDAQPFAGRPG